jgi:hypothetical protein
MDGQSNIYRDMIITSIKKMMLASKRSQSLEHPVLKGRAKEIFVTDLLEPYLNPSYGICTGVIIDPRGEQSRQIDIIIYDKRIIPPALLTIREGVIPCHSVLATIEVKTRLGKKDLENSIQNAASVKNLNYSLNVLSKQKFREIMLSEIVQVLEEKAFIDKDLAEKYKNSLSVHSPACYVFAFKSSLSKKNENKRLQETVQKANKDFGYDLKVPISGLCVSEKVFVSCINANNEPPDFEEATSYPILHFMKTLLNTCNTLSQERWQIPTEIYFG